MIDIMKFFRSIYIYISSKLKFKNNSYENLNDTIYNDNVNDNKNNSEIYDEEYEVFISNIHTNENSK
jgi:hypothetical protein